jgi:hypothetical protein
MQQLESPSSGPKSILSTAHPKQQDGENVPKKKVSFSQNPPQIFHFQKEQKKKKRKNKKNKHPSPSNPAPSLPKPGISMQVVEREPPPKVLKPQEITQPQSVNLQPPSVPSPNPQPTPALQQQQPQQPQKKLSLYQQMKKK